MAFTKNIDILEELKRRIRLEFDPRIHIYEGDGGVWGEWNKRLPCFHLYFHETDDAYSDRQRFCLYTVEQKVQIEYISRVDNVRRLYSEGLEKRNKLVAALQLDTRFQSGFGTETPGDELTILYHRMMSEVVQVVPRVIDVALVYNFVYTENF